MGVAAADYDNDGWTDLYVTGVNRNFLYHNNGDGTFSDVTERAEVGAITAAGKKLWSVSAAWIDYDNDGLLDLFVNSYLDWTPENTKVCGPVGKRLSCHPNLYGGSRVFSITTMAMAHLPTSRARWESLNKLVRGWE